MGPCGTPPGGPRGSSFVIIRHLLAYPPPPPRVMTSFVNSPSYWSSTNSIDHPRVFHLLAQPDWQLLLLLLIQRSQSQPAKRKTIKQQNTAMSPKNQTTWVSPWGSLSGPTSWCEEIWSKNKIRCKTISDINTGLSLQEKDRHNIPHLFVCPVPWHFWKVVQGHQMWHILKKFPQIFPSIIYQNLRTNNFPSKCLSKMTPSIFSTEYFPPKKFPAPA